MPRAFDAPFDGADDPEWFDEESASISDAEAAAMVDPGAMYQEMAAQLDLSRDIDPDALADMPDQRADEAEDAENDDDDTQFVRAWHGPRDLTGMKAGVRPGDSSESTDSVIEESVHETLEAFGAWSVQSGLELVADAVYPGAGRLINIAFMVKEALGDAVALASTDSPRNLHVPLFHIAGGLAVDLNVHLPGRDGPEDDAPLVSGFLSPDDGGLFGGWELEVERQAEPAEGQLSAEDDLIFEAADQAAQQVLEATDWARRDEPPAGRVIEYDLSPVARWVLDRRRRVDALRVTASRLGTRLYARREFAIQPVVVIYDPVAGLGMWLVNPDLSEALAGRRIVIRLKASTGLMTVIIE